MSSSIQKKTQHLAIAHRRRRGWLRVVTAMACVVVFMTTYALILPAITADAADLKQYLNDTGGSITAVTDLEDTQAIPEITYPLSLLVTGGEAGFSPGIYFYKLPQSVHLKTLFGHDIISDNNEKIGSWSVDENETIIFDFTEAAQIPGMQIDLELEISFDGTTEAVTFDGGCQISIYIPPEPPEDETTEPEDSEETTPVNHPTEPEGLEETTPGSDPTVPESPEETTPGSDPTVPEGLEETAPGSNPTVPEGSEETAPGSDPDDQEDSDDTELPQDYPVPYAGTYDLKEYITQHKGSISITLFDSTGQPIAGEVTEGDKYKLTFGMYIPDDGFSPGTYVYGLPDGLRVTPQPGKDIVLADGTVIAVWSLSEDGTLTFEFNESANDYQNIEASLDLIVEFELTDGSIDFDGEVNVTVKPAPVKPPSTPEVTKSGEFDDENRAKLSWSLGVQGGEGFPLGGQTVTDTIQGDNHYYAEDDDTIWAEVYDGNTYYSWRIRRTDTDIVWTESGWTYTIPSAIECRACNDPMFADPDLDPDYDGSAVHLSDKKHMVTLGDDWHAWFFFDSTLRDDGSGTYINDAASGPFVDTATVVVLPESGGGVVKTGELRDGEFWWTIDAVIPGSDTPTYYWHLWDTVKIKPTDNTEYPSEVWKAEVTVEYGGQTLTVPQRGDATANDPFALRYYVSSTNPSEGAELDFLQQCDCTADTCALWVNGECDSSSSSSADRTRFCRCWNQTKDVTFHITYKTENSAEIIEKHGGSGESVRNKVALRHKPVIDGVVQNIALLDDSEAFLPIPGVFNKKLLDNPDTENQYTALFNITVNEELQDLSSMAETGGVTIVDKMSETLFYEAGSMVVKRTDISGNTITLRENVDYTVTMRDVHGMEITIPNPGPYKYTLDYSCVLDLTGYNGKPIPYNNSAEITLFGKTYTVGGEDNWVTEYSASGERFQLTVIKTDSQDGDLLPNAVFRLYNSMGNLMATMTTDKNGKLTFETDMESGLVFRKNQAYYVQETKAPPGYTLDPTMHWFYFADQRDPELDQRIPDILCFSPHVKDVYEGEFTLTNNHQMFELPSTGSSGEAMFYFLSAAAFAAALLTGGGALLPRKKRSGKR